MVLGGGVAGFTAAHELAARGFDVVVYERRACPAARRAASRMRPGTGGRRDLPGEHGFRFFPGFYQHVPDTMRRIPYRGQGARRVRQPRRRRRSSRSRARTRATTRRAAHSRTRSTTGRHHPIRSSHVTDPRHPLADQVHFVGRSSATAHEPARSGASANTKQSWWEFAGAEHRPGPFRSSSATD